MSTTDPQEHWEQRWHPLRRQWVVMAAHRNSRPWSGQETGDVKPSPPDYDPRCYLCPGNARVSGRTNPDYADIFVFDNDHPCVGPGAPCKTTEPPPPYRSRAADGLARVVCYSPRHDLRLAQLPLNNILSLLKTWQDQYRELAQRREVNHVLIFENNGEQVGVSNPHPHCQIYATNFVFPTIAEEADACAEHHAATRRSLLGDMIAAELDDGGRLLANREHAVSFVPYCARYAYETFVAPRRPCQSLAELEEHELKDFAFVLKDTVVRFDNLWRMPFPYVMVLHQAPTDGKTHPGFHFHAEFHPPLRKANLLKFLAGPEVGGGGFIADTWPEEKAAELRAVSGETHYLKTSTNCPNLTGHSI